jgi:predicted glycoside hydrolase/deacetylase ChbG (UPF0249 family)
MAGKRLIVNADDFGFTPGVNEGIVEAHRRGILTAATLMANGAAFEHAVRLARETPTLDVGCHLVLVSGRSVGDEGRALPASVPELLGALAARRIDLHAELSAQVERVVAAGIEPTHIDTHKHTHLAPPVLEAVACVAEEFGIRWVRRPFDFPLTALRGSVPRMQRLASRCVGVLRARFHRALESRQCRTTDHFAGFQMTGQFRTAELVQLLSELPDGLTEFMCHPGRCTDDLMRARTRLKQSRERELEALLAAETRRAIEEGGIQLVNYRELE